MNWDSQDLGDLGEKAVGMNEIMYRSYVIDKIRKGKESADRGELTSIEELKKEVEKW
ncbi:hypothetical protein QUF76_08375 [Desulfobacterales bacterium HSG16]|nr:hypothetical protein [Desulfobacterales bacterium HSG16]